MKTSVSLPDELFYQAEIEARHLGVSRSELYARAISEYMRHRQSDDITARLNKVYLEISSELDPVLARMQILSLPKNDW